MAETGTITVPTPGTTTMRHNQVFYIKGGKIGDKYTLMSVFTDNTEKPSAETTEKKYTVNKTKTKNVTSYGWQTDFTADMIKEDAVIADFVDIGRTMKVGQDANRTLCIVELDEPTGSGSYYARELPVAVVIDEFGDNDGEMQVSGNLAARADVVEGSFDIKTQTFTETTETAAE